MCIYIYIHMDLRQPTQGPDQWRQEGLRGQECEQFPLQEPLNPLVLIFQHPIQSWFHLLTYSVLPLPPSSLQEEHLWRRWGVSCDDPREGVAGGGRDTWGEKNFIHQAWGTLRGKFGLVSMGRTWQTDRKHWECFEWLNYFCFQPISMCSHSRPILSGAPGTKHSSECFR